jgi:hypothetical protein
MAGTQRLQLAFFERFTIPSMRHNVIGHVGNHHVAQLLAVCAEGSFLQLPPGS